MFCFEAFVDEDMGRSIRLSINIYDALLGSSSFHFPTLQRRSTHILASISFAVVIVYFFIYIAGCKNSIICKKLSRLLAFKKQIFVPVNFNREKIQCV